MQYLLNVDGHSAAYRFAMLLGVDSLVFKQASRHREWFYASVRPGVHYLPVLQNRTDVLDQVAWAEARPREAAAIVANANRFALTYTTYYARVVYWIYVLQAYRDLVEGQGRYFETRGAEVRDLVAAFHRKYHQIDESSRAEKKRREEAERNGGGDGEGDETGGSAPSH